MHDSNRDDTARRHVFGAFYRPEVPLGRKTGQHYRYSTKSQPVGRPGTQSEMMAYTPMGILCFGYCRRWERDVLSSTRTNTQARRQDQNLRGFI